MADIPVSYFNTPTLNPFYPGWKHEPVPGWGARPSMAGPRMVGVGASPTDAVHPAMQELQDEAAQLYPNDKSKQAAHVLTKGPGLARTLDQWLRSPDSEPYRAKAAARTGGVIDKFKALPTPQKAAILLVPLAIVAFVVLGKKKG